jgi:hypothetical protein
MLRPVTVSLLAAASLVMPATAQDIAAIDPMAALGLPPLDAASAYAPGTLVLFFNGGKADYNAAAAISDLLDLSTVIPTKLHRVAQGDTICGLLLSQGFPNGCSAYLPLIEKLNAGIALGRLTIGQEITIPVLDFRGSRTIRTLPNGQRSTSDWLSGSWRSFNPTLKQATDRSRVEFDRFELRLKMANSAQQTAARDKVAALGLANVSIETIPFSPAPSSGYSVTADDVKTRCTQGELVSTPVDYYSYAFEDDAPIRAPAPSQYGRSIVYIVDVPLIRGPNLLPASSQSVWSCQWSAYEPRHHSTHMAGIAASRSNGFKGIAETTAIADLIYRSPAASPQQLPVRDHNALLRMAPLFGSAVELAGGLSIDTIPVFLVASSFYEPSDYPASTSAEERFSGPNSEVARGIQAGGGLFVVSAGQRTGATSGIELSARYGLSPQNLGDLPNVVVVTACSRCARKDARLMPDANYDRDRRFVHLAAPGGMPLPGWINKDSLGATSGTSQAAAYVAGLAADMMARHPSAYRFAWQVKQRLQATSAPLRASDGSPNRDAEKLSAGLVDPELATLDPTKDWIRQGGKWTEVRVRGWMRGYAAPFRTVGVKRYDLSEALRISRSGGSYTVYRQPSETKVVDGKGALRIEEVGVLVATEQEMPILNLCSGDSVRLADVDDYLPRLGQVASLALGDPC